MANELKQQIEAQRNQLEEQPTNVPLGTEPKSTMIGRGMTKTASINRLNLQEQLAIKEEQRQELIRALAGVRADMVKIAEGNSRSLKEEEKQNLSIEALINTRTAQLQEKIDDDEKQIVLLRQELKKQKTLAQQFADQAMDAQGKLSKQKKLDKFKNFENFFRSNREKIDKSSTRKFRFERKCSSTFGWTTKSTESRR